MTGADTRNDKDVERMLGDPKKAIKSMLPPLILSYLVVQINMFVDTAWCSGLGINEISAVATMSIVYWLICAIGTSIGVGMSVLISGHIANGRRDAADKICVQSFYLGLLFSIIMTAILLPSVGWIIDSIGAGNIHAECMSFSMPFVAASTILILNGTVAGMLMGEGAAKKSMAVLLTCAVTNLILDPILIYGFDLRLFGAGMATVISATMSLSLGLYWYLSKRTYVRLSFRKNRPDKTLMKDILAMSLPKMTESTTVNIMSLVQRIFVIIAAGTIGVSLYIIPWRFVSLSMVTVAAISASMIPVCSAAFSRKDYDKASVGFNYAFKLSMAVLVVISILIFVFADPLISLFTQAESVHIYKEKFIWVLRIYTIFIPFFGMVELGSSMLQVLRKGKYATVSSLIRNIIITAMFWAVCGISFDWIIYCLLVAEIFGGLLMITWAYYEFKKVRKPKVSPT